MPITRLRPSFSFTQDRLEQLKAIAPEALADGKINWEALKQALGEFLEDENPEVEHFGLFWPGKREARRLAIPSSICRRFHATNQRGLGGPRCGTH